MHYRLASCFARHYQHGLWEPIRHVQCLNFCLSCLQHNYYLLIITNDISNYRTNRRAPSLLKAIDTLHPFNFGVTRSLNQEEWDANEHGKCKALRTCNYDTYRTATAHDNTSGLRCLWLVCLLVLHCLRRCSMTKKEAGLYGRASLVRMDDKRAELSPKINNQGSLYLANFQGSYGLKVSQPLRLQPAH